MGKIYVFEHGFVKAENMTPDEIRRNEKKHGELIKIVYDGKSVYVDNRLVGGKNDKI